METMLIQCMDTRLFLCAHLCVVAQTFPRQTQLFGVILLPTYSFVEVQKIDCNYNTVQTNSSMNGVEMWTPMTSLRTSFVQHINEAN